MTNEELKAMYLELGIDVNALGCIMLDTDVLKVSDIVPEDALYFSDNMKYAQGIVSEVVPHVTLLFGLMQSGLDLKKYINMLLKDIVPKTVTIEEVTTFDNMDGDVPYSCYVAKVAVTEDLTLAHTQLQRLPHIDDYPTYQPHITLFYAKQDDTLKVELLDLLNERFWGKKVKVNGINFGA